MTCKVCCNLTHLIDRPHMQTCPRWIGGGALAYMVSPPPLDPPSPCFLRKYHGFSNFRMVDFSAFFNNELHKVIPGHISKIGNLLDF